MKFSNRKGLLFFSIFCTIFSATSFVIVVTHGGIDKNNSALLFGALSFYFLYMTLCSFVIATDITIDNDGFHRSVFERKLFSIRWCDISIITDRMDPSVGGEKMRFITVVPCSEFPRKVFAKKFMRLGAGIIVFSDFIRAFNNEIKKYNIPVELSRDGKTVMQEEILLRIPEGQLWNPMRD